MKHAVKKIKIKQGVDANRALMRKLIINLLRYGKVTTTLSRAKTLKAHADKIIALAIKKTPASVSQLHSRLNSEVEVKRLVEQIAPKFKDRIGGYTKLVRIGFRKGDGSQMGTLKWVEDISEIYPKKTASKKSKKESSGQESEKKSDKKAALESDKK